MSLSDYFPISAHGHGRRGPPSPSLSPSSPRPAARPNPSHFLHLSSIKLITLENNLLYPTSSLPPPKNAPTIVSSKNNGAARDSAELLRRSLLIHNAVTRAEREVRDRAQRVEREMAFGGQGFMDVRPIKGSRVTSTRESIVEVSEDEEEDDGIPTIAVRHITPVSSTNIDASHIHSADEEAWFEQTWRELHADTEAEGTLTSVTVVEPDFGDFDDVEEENVYEDEETMDIDRVETSVVMPSTILSITPSSFSLDSAGIADGSDISFFPLLVDPDFTSHFVDNSNKTKTSHGHGYDAWEVPSAPVLRPTLVKDKFYTGLVASRVTATPPPAPVFMTTATMQAISAPPALESDPESDSDADDDAEECVTPTQDILDDFSSSSMARSSTSSNGDFDPVHDDYATERLGEGKGGAMFGMAGGVKSTAQRSTLWGRDIYDAGDEAGEW